jgi:hypothetical protein
MWDIYHWVSSALIMRRRPHKPAKGLVLHRQPVTENLHDHAKDRGASPFYSIFPWWNMSVKTIKVNPITMMSTQLRFWENFNRVHF